MNDFAVNALERVTDSGVARLITPEAEAVPPGLRFAEPVESDFQRDYFQKSAVASRLAAIGGLAMWLSFGVLDYWLLPDNYLQAWAIRFGITGPYFLLMILLAYSATSRRFLQYYTSSAMFLCGFSIVLMIAMSNASEPAHAVYFAGIILVHMGGYAFLSLRFPYAATTNIAILASFEVVFLLLGDGVGSSHGRTEFLYSNFFLVGANILGLWSCYRLDYFARRDYLLRRQSDNDVTELRRAQEQLVEQARQTAALEERQRLSRELHDSVSQALYGISLGARTARHLLDRDPLKAVEPVEYVMSLAEAGLAEMRALIFELRPDSLESEGLLSAIQKQAAAVTARYGLMVSVSGDEPEVTASQREVFYRVAQEALNNVIKHARATNVEVSLRGAGGLPFLEIRDNGVGFKTGLNHPGHLGLRSMAERAESIGATLRITSEPGEGATVSLELAGG